MDPLHEAVQDHLGPRQRIVDLSQAQESPNEPSEGDVPMPRDLSVSRRAASEQSGSLEGGQNEEELESTIRDYLADLSGKALAEMPYIGELSGLTFAKLAKA